MAKYRLLIVDDDPETSLILSAWLAEEYESFVAGNGLDALLQIAKIEPDLMIVDVMMPVMDGFELLRRIRSTPGFEKTVVVFLTAKDSDQSIRKGYETGADVYLTKPFDPDMVRILLRNLIEDTELRPRPKAFTAEDLARFQMSRQSVAHGLEGNGEAQVPDTRPRVLIVDDDPVILEFLSMLCCPEFQVLTATDGLEAIDQAYSFKPDLFVIDRLLPRVSGEQVVRLLQATPEFQTTPIVLISARPERKGEAFVEKLGVEEFMIKPLDPERLLTRLREIVAAPDFCVRRSRPSLPFETAETGLAARISESAPMEGRSIPD